MSGYSATPLVKKLGIKPGFSVYFHAAPDHYSDLLGPLPEAVDVRKAAGPGLDFIHLFARNKEQLTADLLWLKDLIQKNGMIWVSWYKKSSKIPTDITEDSIREVALPLGLVDIKVCAVDEQWSGLKLVWRKELR
ncbi:DUF3052 family protein [Flavilitoribacter nigricans]|uniref:DUF3052 domain-containing protein n=1 Tax=Flavilitoribacter nigricans (strain ATCC 23147 / DSM 23189 / NBRC 102662 / NCIMB 1420 / SS-2) TaxID=1122177 RepID=A0A2D0ND90_FLAN2|nr:DUF3052 family protein [Flavilitoribacter nigricans]PHN06336.1 DUF3052 domain-containing protein [Flavilitoribacter nigricans DSM 23189 = NBRC 102662]